jgi:hypothetical protein
MSTDYAYVEQWNAKVSLPILDKEWITEDTAREQYQSRRFDVVPGFVLEGQEQEPRVPAPWVLTVWSEGVSAFTSVFYTPGGSVFRTIEWKDEGERIFKWIVVDYTYADDDAPHRLSDSTMIVNGKFNTDGTGTLTINDKSKPTVDRLSMDHVDVSGNWLDRPVFGEWEPLLDPGLGTMPGAPA